MNRTHRTVAVVATCLTVSWIAACSDSDERRASTAGESTVEATFVGRESCAPCHETANRLWEGSHHDLAMQEANERTVLGDFDDATFSYNGVTSTFFRREGDFWVRTDGPDGKLEEYPIAYTFGVEPLQQYLIEFPGGRYQALGICWDTRPAAEGGQRWFHLYPDEAVDSDDPLHWTGIHQNWNYMCAECHSTDLKKGYDLATDSFETTWQEIDVSCEACHGPGSEHVAWANAPKFNRDRYDNGHFGLTVRLEDPGRGTWMINPETGNGLRMAPPVETHEIETCARCHSRRSLISEDYRFARPIMDTHRVALLEEGLYHADGQILEEVYVYGSYLQSKMYQQGVTCVDCHDAHTNQLHFPGDAVCFRCHSQVKYAAEEHHFHKPGTAGAACVDCHMPPKNYMVVDPRHDHSLRVPRPDLSVALGTPNACNGCHVEKSNQWSVDWVVKWYGEGRRQEPRYGEVLAEARRGQPEAERRLVQLIQSEETPGIVKGTALDLLGRGMSQSTVPFVAKALRDPDPLVRMGALRSLEALPPAERLRMAMPLLSDPLRTIRVEAVRVLSGVPREAFSPDQSSLLMGAVEEYREAQAAIAERPEAHLNLGWLEASLGDFSAAEREYRLALERDPRFIPAYVNLADLYRSMGRDADGARLLEDALEVEPDVAEVHHALGLLQVRQGRAAEALQSLGRAAELAPGHSRFAYVYAVALHDLGQADAAIAVLTDAHERTPNSAEVLYGLVGFLVERNEPARALEYAERLLALDPTNGDVQRMVQQLSANSR